MAMKLNFGFSVFFIVDRLAIKLFFYISADFIPNSITFF